MKSRGFMDKQIMELSRSQTSDFFHFSKPLEDSDEEEVEEDDDDRSRYSPNFAFHRTRSLGPSQLHPSTLGNCSSMDHIDSIKVTHGKVKTSYDTALIFEIDQTMEELCDKLLHAVEGLNVRLSQLESKTHRLENAVDDLRVCAEYNYGRTDGKLRLLENILRGVQDGVQLLRDKQEIAENQLQLAKLQVSKGGPQSEDRNSVVQTDSTPQTALSAQQAHQPLPSSGTLPLSHPILPPSMPTLPYQNPPPDGAPVAELFPTKFPQNQIPFSPLPESYNPPAGQTSETKCQQYHMPPTQQYESPFPPPQQPYQPTPLPQLHPPLGAVNPQNPPFSHHPEERSYMSSHSYPPSILESSSQLTGGASTQQFYVGATQQMDGQSLRRPYSEFPAKYSPTPGPANYGDMHPFYRSPPHYSSTTMKVSQPFPSPTFSGGGNDYAQLPKAQILPHALPTASIVDSGSDSGGTKNGVPIDDVVEKVTAMGFRRDLARATVRKLTENGQSVDLNVVLDKLMNNGDVQPQKGWSGR